jgi:hypothetical protein
MQAGADDAEATALAQAAATELSPPTYGVLAFCCDNMAPLLKAVLEGRPWMKVSAQHSSCQREAVDIGRSPTTHFKRRAQ